MIFGDAADRWEMRQTYSKLRTTLTCPTSDIRIHDGSIMLLRTEIPDKHPQIRPLLSHRVSP